MSLGESWGHFPKIETEVRELWWLSELSKSGVDPFLPVGLGRSYGDSALLSRAKGSMLSIGRCGRFVSFDATNRILEVEAGCSIDEVLKWCLPMGYFLPVVPGTSHVTLGGAIANDIHGKNHHEQGTFGRSVLGFELWRNGEEPIWCDRKTQAGLFAATIGGLGLTGVIGRVRLSLIPIAGKGLIGQKSIRFGCLLEGAEALESLDREYPMTVAWIDMASAKIGRGVAMGGEFIEGRCESSNRRSLSIPICAPNFLLNRLAIRGFNTLYSATRKEGDAELGFRSFFFPLDGVENWGKLYGKRGFLQYQCVVPMNALDALLELQSLVAHSGQGAFLSVLKKFGSLESPGVLSFPFAGWTLAMDFPNEGASTLALFSRLDDVVKDAGGRLYPAKDARMSGEFFRDSYPEWIELEQVRDERITSEFWERVKA
ncbi:FAD-binding oxidoreductase [Roseibacillus persicicus]|uniref:FAD-binding oxidoreductase n=1 Tax=Roseibacillus persicicus TaxID=454148 RepID=UPI00280FA834|nr:FAD-binding oxidoreductase [Roseibacillus persicicus]MDQ8188869.1 FAD-binding oxidoreductase [Roseibacillus persicicus]